MIIKLLANYFKDASYHSHNDCPLARAIKHAMAIESNKVSVGIYRSYINGETYFHEGYLPEAFTSDYNLANLANFDDTVIREIELGKY